MRIELYGCSGTVSLVSVLAIGGDDDKVMPHCFKRENLEDTAVSN